MSDVKTLERGLALLDALCLAGVDGQTRDALSAAAGIPAQTTWRLLKTLEKAGWIEELEPNKAGQARFRLNAYKLINTAFAFKRNMLKKRQNLEKNYAEITGEQLDE
jgi:DNA-binding IclR family transcriptional regulator